MFTFVNMSFLDCFHCLYSCCWNSCVE